MSDPKTAAILALGMGPAPSIPEALATPAAQAAIKADPNIQSQIAALSEAVAKAPSASPDGPSPAPAAILPPESQALATTAPAAVVLETLADLCDVVALKAGSPILKTVATTAGASSTRGPNRRA